MLPPQPVQVTCPQCNQPFTAQLHSIIDAGEQPELKDQLLRGRLNVAQCPHCSAAGAIGSPILYHDPDKELAFVLMPTELNLSRDEQETLIGTLTNTLMDSLPAEQRKGYLLQPRTFLSLENLMRAVLEADGITPEMLESQQKRVQLLNDLRSRIEDEEQFESFVEQHRDDVDYELFLILRAMIDTARQDGMDAEAETLEALHRRLLDITGGPSGPAPGEVQVENFDDLLNVMQDVDSSEELQALVATNRAVFDYAFFQALTNRIEAAEQSGDTERVTELRQLRQDILGATETVDRATQEALQGAAQRLGAILDADDPHAAIREQLDEIDEPFLIVLSANIAQAEEQGQDDVVQVLRHLQDYTLGLLEEQMPPQARVLNRLMRADGADERTKVLENAGDLVDAELVQALEAIADNARAQGQTQLVNEVDELITLVKGHIDG
ncbi:MAG: hypothetical protein MAG451_02219 [Anaerolineales bacterium]|nr:hypothetical protein [Anaerolineales bacterium]